MYPYDFKTKRFGINHQEIFVVMPFNKKFDFIFTDLIKSATKYANTKLNNTAGNKLKAFRTKDDIRTKSGWIEVLEHLVTAQIVLGVLTSYNQNVFYELGIAHATQPISRQILLANKGHKSSFDIKDLIYFEYNDKNIQADINPLGEKIADAIKFYKIDQEKLIRKALMRIGPFGFRVTMEKGLQSHFAIHSDNPDERMLLGIENLCIAGLLGLNYLPVENDGKKRIEFSYYWTGLGNDALHSLNIIEKDELQKRREKLPKYFE